MKLNAKKCYVLGSRHKSSHFYTNDDHILQQVQNNPFRSLDKSCYKKEDLQTKTQLIQKQKSQVVQKSEQNLKL